MWWLLCLVFLLGRGAAVETVQYSFRVPAEWGTLSLRDAKCCPQGRYPKNVTVKGYGLPDAIGLGVQKGGSTSVSLYMGRHSAYVNSKPKETHFFDKAFGAKLTKNYQNAWKRRGNANSTRYEFTPSYLWIPFAACRIKKIFPDMRFIVILRDPVERAYSEFNMVRSRCHWPGKVCSWKHDDFYDYAKIGVHQLMQRRCSFNDGNGMKNWNDCFQCLLFADKMRRVCKYRPYYFALQNRKSCFFFGAQFITRGLYAAQLAWWFELFPPQNFLIINSHEFFEDSVNQLNRVNAFFGVEKPFQKWMTKSKGMTGHYTFKDPHKEEAKTFLRKYYTRPNQELYKLLDEVGLGPFKAFEERGGSPKAKPSTPHSPQPEELPEAANQTPSGQHPITSTDADRTKTVSPKKKVRSNPVTRKESKRVIGNSAADKTTDETSNEVRLVIIGKDIAFHVTPHASQGFSLPRISNLGYFFGLTLLLIATIIWLRRYAPSSITSLGFSAT